VHGSDIYFGAGQYRSDDSSGRWLLAHEIAHTLQDAPNVIARFVDGDTIPAPPQESAGDEIETALSVDPQDSSGRVAELLSKMSPRQRAAAVTKMRARGLPEGYEDGLGQALKLKATPLRKPEPDLTDENNTNAGTRLQNKIAAAPMPVRTVAPPRPPPVEGSRPKAAGPPASTGAPSKEIPSQGAAPPGSAGPAAAEEITPAPAPAEQAPAADENAPLHLSDLLEERTQPAPTAEPTPAPMPETTPDATETDFIPLNLGPAPAVSAGEAPAEDAADIAGQMEGFAAQLEKNLAQTQESLATQSETARNSVRQQAASARAGIRGQIARTTSEIRAGSDKLLADLDQSVRAAHAQVAACLVARQAETTTAGADGAKNVSGLFDGHRKTVDQTITDSIGAAEKLRTDKAAEAQKRNRADIRTAYIKGGAKMNSYPSTLRGAYIGGAAFDVAEGSAIEMQKQEPDIVAGVAEVTAPLPEHFRAQGAQALDGFDIHLPEILQNVASGMAQTAADLSRKAADADRNFDEMAAQTRTEIGTLTSTVLEQVAAFGPQLEAQLDHAMTQITRSISSAPADVLARVSQPVQEAIDLLRTAENPDTNAARQLTDVLTGFLDETAAGVAATMEQAGEAGGQRFQQISAAAGQAMRAQKTRCETFWKGARSNLTTTLPKTVEAVDAGFGGSVKVFSYAIAETEKNITDQLTPAVTQLKGGFKDNLRDAEGQIDQRINDGLSKNTEALNDLDSKMEEAADDAAFEWDHPVLSALEFLAGLIVGIVKVLAMVLVLLVVTLILAAVLGISAFAAGLVLLGAMVAFAIGYGFGARLAAGQGVGEAFIGSVTDFGKAAPGMLYDMTGIPKLKRAFSDEHMSRYERGKLVGEGATEFVLAIFMVRGAAKGIAGKFRSLPKVPPPTGSPAVRLPAELPAEATVKPTVVQTPTAPRLPVEAPTPPRLPVEAPTGAPRLPAGESSSIPKPAELPSPTTSGRGRFGVIEGGGEPSSVPRPKPELRVIRGGGGAGRPPVAQEPAEPFMPEAQPQRAKIAAGGEGFEPVLGETPQQPQRFKVIEGGAERAGGRSPMEIRASAESGGSGGGPRPASPRTPAEVRASAESGGGGPSGPRPSPSRPTSQPTAGGPISEPAGASPRPTKSASAVEEPAAPRQGENAPEPVEEAQPKRPSREARAGEKRTARQQAEAENEEFADEGEGRGGRTGKETGQEAREQRGESRRVREQAQRRAEENLDRARRGELSQLSETHKARLLRRFERLLRQAFPDRATVQRNQMKGQFDEGMRTTTEARTSGRVQQRYVKGNEAIPEMDLRIRGAAIPDEVVPRMRNGRVRFEYRNLKGDNIHEMDAVTARSRARAYLAQAKRNDLALPQRDSIVLRFAQRPNEAARDALLQVFFGPDSPIAEVHFGSEVVPNPNLP